MREIKNQIFGEERALYGAEDVRLVSCTFAGEADGESALKECKNVECIDCRFDLRYPLWHDDGAALLRCVMSDSCRAALWYTTKIDIKDSTLHGIKALRECSNISMSGCDIESAEFGWMSEDIKCRDCSAVGEYFMFRARNLDFCGLNFRGKYSFQYVENARFENCNLDTKDAFWHARNVYVKDSVVKGEYLGWYCEDVTFENCKIIGTQPLCYCKGLKLINCECIECDLSFEKSEVEATIIGNITSIKNPKSGTIRVDGADELIFDDGSAEGKVVFTAKV